MQSGRSENAPPLRPPAARESRGCFTKIWVASNRVLEVSIRKVCDRQLRPRAANTLADVVDLGISAG